MRPQGTVDVRVHVGDDLGRAAVTVLDGRLDLGEPVGAVGEIELDGTLRVVQDRPVPRQDGVDAVVDGEGPQPPQRVQVVPQTPVRMRHDGRTAPQDGVPGQHGLIGREMEAQRVPGVPGRRHHDQFQPADPNDLPGPQPLVPEPQRRIQRAHLGTGQLGEPDGTFRVVGVPVRQQGQRDAFPRLLRGVDDVPQMPLVQRPRVDHHGQLGVGLRHDPRVRAVQGHRGRVGREDVEGTRGGGAGQHPATWLAGEGGCVGHAGAPSLAVTGWGVPFGGVVMRAPRPEECAS